MFRITFGLNGIARSVTITAESEGEAIELWELQYEYFDSDVEFVGCVEIDND